MADDKKTEAPVAKDAENIDDLLARYGTIATSVQVWVRDENQRNPWVYLTTETDAEAMDLGRIRRVYGGGTFDLRFTGKGTGRVGGYLGHVEVTIAGPERWRDLSKVSTENDTTSNSDQELTAARRRSEELEAKIRRLEEQGLEARVMGAIADLKSYVDEMRRPPPQADTAAVLPMVFELVKNLQQTMQPHLQTPVQSTGLELLPSILELVKSSMDLGARQVGDGAGAGGGDYLTFADRLLPMIDRLVTQATSKPAALAAGSQPDATPQPVEAPAMPNDVNGVLRSVGPTLISWARAQSDPRIRAYQTLEDLSVKWQNELGDWLQMQGGSAVTQVVAQVPELAEHRAWVDAYVGSLREALIEDPENPDVAEAGD